MASIELKGITKQYEVKGRAAAVKEVDLTIEEGEVMTLLGPSGCGKTTLLKMIAGLIPPDQGEIWIGGRLMNGVPPAQRDVAMVFQNYALYPHLSVRENIGVPLSLRGMSHEETERRVQEVATLLKIEDVLGQLPKALSGGQRQRVAVARAIVRRPKAFLLDEPLSNLDAVLREHARTELKILFQSLAPAAVIYVTHDQLEAMTLGHRVAIMDQGRLIQVGAPQELYHRPATTFVATFVGTPPMNLVKSEDISGAPGPLLGIRAEDITLLPASMSTAIEGKVMVVESVGASAMVTVHLIRAPEVRLKVVVQRQEWPVGASVWLSWRSERVQRFDPVTGLRYEFDL